MPEIQQQKPKVSRGAMGNKGKLEGAEYERLLKDHLKWLALEEQRQHNQQTLRKYRKPRRGRNTFDHLPAEIKLIAEQKYAAYKEKHKAKLASLTGLARVRYLGCLAGCAAAHALHKGTLNGLNCKRITHIGYHRKRIRTRLGLREPHPFTVSHERNPDGSRRTRRNDGGVLQQTVMQGIRQPNAEQGQTNLDGI
jgi:hypothetical protein